MAIKITYNGGVYEISGSLNSQNSDSLMIHIETLMKHSRGVIITLNKVIGMDTYAVKRITDFYNKAVSSDQLFYIIGRENTKVNEQFLALNSSDILL